VCSAPSSSAANNAGLLTLMIPSAVEISTGFAEAAELGVMDFCARKKVVENISSAS